MKLQWCFLDLTALTKHCQLQQQGTDGIMCRMCYEAGLNSYHMPMPVFLTIFLIGNYECGCCKSSIAMSV